MNRKCLKCNKDFEAIRDTAKFCSTSCRVMYNRARPKKDKGDIKPFQMQVLYDSILNLIETYKPELPQDFKDVKAIGVLKSNGDVQQMFPPKPKIRRSFDNYRQLKLECESQEAWEELKLEIIASELTEKQKNLLIN